MTTTTKANNNNNNNIAFAIPSTSEMFRLVHAKAAGAYALAGCEEWAKIINALQYEYRAHMGFPVVTKLNFNSLTEVDIEFSILALPATTYGEIGNNLLQLLPIYVAAFKALPKDLVWSLGNKLKDRSFSTMRDQVLEELMEEIPLVTWDLEHVNVIAEYHYETSLRSDLPSDIQLRVTHKLALAARLFNIASFAWFSQMIEKRLARAYVEFTQTTQVPPEIYATVVKFANQTRDVVSAFERIENAMHLIKQGVQEAERERQFTPTVKTHSGPTLAQLTDDVIANIASLLD